MQDWSKEVGKGTTDALVGVRDQAGFDAAMVVTTKGFTSGAVDVAVDESISMIVLRQFRPGDGPFVREVAVTVAFPDTTYESWDLAIETDSEQEGDLTFRLTSDVQLRYLDGTPAERLGEILSAHATPLGSGEGAFRRTAELEGERLIVAEDGTEARLSRVSWTEKVRMDGITTTHKATGNPCLVIEQLDENGEVHNGRLVVDDHLYAWEIGEDGQVIPRGALG